MKTDIHPTQPAKTTSRVKSPTNNAPPPQAQKSANQVTMETRGWEIMGEVANFLDEGVEEWTEESRLYMASRFRDMAGLMEELAEVERVLRHI